MRIATTFIFTVPVFIFSNSTATEVGTQKFLTAALQEWPLVAEKLSFTTRGRVGSKSDKRDVIREGQG